MIVLLAAAPSAVPASAETWARPWPPHRADDNRRGDGDVQDFRTQIRRPLAGQDARHDLPSFERRPILPHGPFVARAAGDIAESALGNHPGRPLFDIDQIDQFERLHVRSRLVAAGIGDVWRLGGERSRDGARAGADDQGGAERADFKKPRRMSLIIVAPFVW